MKQTRPPAPASPPFQVIQILDEFRYGGAESVALNYAATLSRLGRKNLITALKHSSREAPVPSVRLFERNKEFLNFLKNESKNPTLFICHSSRALLKIFAVKRSRFFQKIFSFGSKLKSKNPPPKVLYVQHLFFPERKFRIYAAVINRLADLFIRITPLTEELTRSFIRIPVFPLINYIPDRTSESALSSGNRELFNAEKKKAEELRKSCEGKTVITCLGAVKKGKNASHLADLARVFREKNRDDFLFLLIGDGEEMNQVRTKVQEFKLRNFREVGYAFYPELYLELSDYLFFPSGFSREMMPMVILEALRKNCRVLAYDSIRVCRRILPSSHLIPHGDFEAAFQKITAGSLRTLPLQWNESYGEERFRTLLSFFPGTGNLEESEDEERTEKKEKTLTRKEH